MSTQVSAIGQSGQFFTFPNPIESTRDPTTADILSPSGAPYQPGQEWINTSTQAIFTYAGGGTWSTSVVSQATETTAGIAKISTAAEATTGTDDTTIMTPAKVALVAIAGAPDATTTTKGIIEIATDGEAAAFSSGSLALVPSNLPFVYASPPAIGSTTPAGGAFTTLSASGAFSLTGDQVQVAEGGTGAATLTDHGIMLGSGTSPVSVSGVGSNNQILIGQTGADPIWTTNVDLPGTLDVTGAATFDSTVTISGAMTFDDSVTITGALEVDGLLTGNASATIDTAGTALNLATDNSGDAVNIGTGTVARALSLGTSAAAHTIALGSSSGGAMTWDTAAGLSFDAATASNFSVSGAADLTLESVGGSAVLQSAQAAVADSVLIQATAADGGVTIKAGSNGILIGTDADTTPLSIGDVAPSASRTTTIGGGTVVTASVTDLVDIAPDGATTNADSIKQVDINTGTVATGQVLTNVATGTVTSGTHTTEIATGNRAAGTMALNIMTGTGTKTASLGNADGLTTLNIDAITLINDSINVNTSINTGTSTGTVSIGNAAAGALTMDTAANISLDSATASNFTVTGASADLTLSSVGGSVDIAASEAAADAIVLNASDASGGIDLLTGGGEISIAATGGNVTLLPATNSVAGTSLTLNARVGVATFTGETTAAGSNLDLTITNSALGAGDGVFCTVSNKGTQDADITLEGVITETAGTLTIHTQNNGSQALNGDVIVAFWIIN